MNRATRSPLTAPTGTENGIEASTEARTLMDVTLRYRP